MGSVRRQGALRIGASGFMHDHWDGVFYPAGMAPAQRLAFYAKTFDTIELDTTFFRTPSPAELDAWREETPKSFTFAVRGNKVITHNRMLSGCAAEVSRFRLACVRLGSKMGPVLWQIPPGMRLDLPRLDRFLRVVTRTSRTRHAFEFRDHSWHAEDVYGVLRRYNAALALTDVRRAVIDDVVTTDFVYMRRHGAGGSDRRPYTYNAQRRDAEAIREWLGEGRDVFVYFINDADGHAIRNARRLRELCTA